MLQRSRSLPTSTVSRFPSSSPVPLAFPPAAVAAVSRRDSGDAAAAAAAAITSGDIAASISRLSSSESPA